MSDIAIKVENLGKQYKIGAMHPASRDLRETLIDATTAPFRRMRDLVRGHSKSAADLSETFWALQDINFEVSEGEVLGIIGHNGAGKSTLLKILTRITYPTTGRVTTYGRIGSLLEVGTGFHPELTGHENVFLNGSILGMSRSEVQRKFDDIVSFAGIEAFINTPVKHYSSGMRVRLAFAVAAHLEPEILLVDEVLAVGDIAFQNRSMGKMGEVARSGRTILFVSHNMGAISNLCERVILLDHGRIAKVGRPDEVIPDYLSAEGNTDARVDVNAGDPEVAVIRTAAVMNDRKEYSNNLDITKDYAIAMEIDVVQPIESCQIAITVIAKATGTHVLTSTHMDKRDINDSFLKPGRYRVVFHLPGHLLNAGLYTFHGRIWGMLPGKSRSMIAGTEGPVTFQISETGSIQSKFNDRRTGVVIPLLDVDFEVQSGG